MNNIKKLGFGIIAFEGVEHIKNILYEIRDLVDVIVICLQEKSYHGDDISQDDVKIVEELKELGYADSIIWFEPTNLHQNEGPSGPRMIETDKRNFILDYLEFAEHCSHSMIIDSDEFYHHDDFKRAKDIIDNDENNQLQICYCQYVNYYRDYNHTLIWPFHAYVPFITNSSYRFDFKHGSFDKPSDPTRRYLIKNSKQPYCILDFSVVKMHHLSFIRIDIRKKIDNWSAKRYFEDVDNLPEKIVDRYENYVDGQSAILAFNTPNNKVLVNKLSKQYIFPHYRLDERPSKYVKYESSNISNGNIR